MFKLNKVLKFICLILILSVMALPLVACAKPVEDEHPSGYIEEFFEDQEYNLEYTDSIYIYKLNLDGNQHCSTYKSAQNTFSEEFTIDYDIDVDGIFNVYRTKLGNLSLFLYEDGHCEPYEYGNEKDGLITSGKSLDLTKDYVYTYKSYLDGVEVQNKFVFNFQKASSVSTCTYKYLVIMEEYLYAQGEYSISNKRYIKMNMNIENVPAGCFMSYEYVNPVVEEDHVVSARYNNNNETGIIRLTNTKGVNTYVQLYNDGSFEFIPNQYAAPKANKEVLVTTDDRLYRSKEYICEKEFYYKQDKYVFIERITFDEYGYVTYKITDCTMERNYKVQDDNSLLQIPYDINVYNSMLGTHTRANSDDVVSFSNKYIIYARYNEHDYSFEIKDFEMREYKDYDYMILHYDSETAYTDYVLCAYFYKDGTWEWDVSNTILPKVEDEW